MVNLPALCRENKASQVAATVNGCPQAWHASVAKSGIDNGAQQHYCVMCINCIISDNLRSSCRLKAIDACVHREQASEGEAAIGGAGAK
jgi:hypothetical protein